MITKHAIIFYVTLLCLTHLSGCSIEKRLHNPGWHVRLKSPIIQKGDVSSRTVLERTETSSPDAVDFSSELVLFLDTILNIPTHKHIDLTVSKTRKHNTILDSKPVCNPLLKFHQERVKLPMTAHLPFQQKTIKSTNESNINWGKIMFWLLMLGLIALLVLTISFTGPGPNYAAILLIIILVFIIVGLLVLIANVFYELLFGWWV